MRLCIIESQWSDIYNDTRRKRRRLKPSNRRKRSDWSNIQSNTTINCNVMRIMKASQGRVQYCIQYNWIIVTIVERSLSFFSFSLSLLSLFETSRSFWNHFKYVFSTRLLTLALNSFSLSQQQKKLFVSLLYYSIHWILN